MFFRRAKPSPPPEQRRLGDAIADGQTVITADTRIIGSLNSQTGIRISGYVEGDILSKGIVLMEPGGVVIGTITAGGVIVAGELSGDIASGGRVEVRATGRVSGDIVCSRIAIEDGGSVKGQIRMPGSEDEFIRYTEKRFDR